MRRAASTSGPTTLAPSASAMAACTLAMSLGSAMASWTCWRILRLCSCATRACRASSRSPGATPSCSAMPIAALSPSTVGANTASCNFTKTCARCSSCLEHWAATSAARRSSSCALARANFTSSNSVISIASCTFADASPSLASTKLNLCSGVCGGTSAAATCSGFSAARASFAAGRGASRWSREPRASLPSLPSLERDLRTSRSLDLDRRRLSQASRPSGAIGRCP
mmetsp:Transcript_82206/g.236238  ORF Transcript_82206/g.236238 Transcript_82206/m.236238 type:complete len:227 (+) Transcript_82206:2365-3045(+)